jgi:3'-phosphoadenosine 5'-phosphosulfate sulfotransferase (PAPS reductase)/FAD synthetase
VFVLETGALHTETLALLERTQARSRAPIKVFRPVSESVIQFVREKGQDAMYQSMDLRKACCGIRKMEPLARALTGQRAWITGLRQEQSNARAEVPLLDTSEETTKNLAKFNPLARWTWGDVWHYIATLQVDYNPLHDRASAAPLAPEPSAWAKSSAQAAGGGKTRRPRNVGCTSRSDFPFECHPRERGDPCLRFLDPRFRGDDEEK